MNIESMSRLGGTELSKLELEWVEKNGKTLDDYGNEARKRGMAQCLLGHELGWAVQRYDHDGGWFVKGFKCRQWLWVECTDPTHHYEYSLTRFVPRNWGDPPSVAGNDDEGRMRKHGERGRE
jgi:hypothetical protein